MSANNKTSGGGGRRFIFESKSFFENTKEALELLASGNEQDYNDFKKPHHLLIMDYENEIAHCTDMFFIYPLKEKWECTSNTFCMFSDMMKIMWFSVLNGCVSWKGYQLFTEYLNNKAIHNSHDENMTKFISFLLNAGYGEENGNG